MFRPYMWAIFRLPSNILGAAIQDVWGVLWVLGVEWGKGRDLLVFNSGYHDLGLLQVDYISFLCTRVKVGFYSYAKDMLQLVILVTI